jgi:hypothetical protein
MVNAWSLLGSLLNGTLDEDYPIMTKEGVDGHGDVREVKEKRFDDESSQDFWKEDGHSVVGNPMPAPPSNDTITFGSDTVIGAAQPVDYASYFGAGEDSLSFSSTEESEQWVKDHGGYEWTPGSAWPPNVELADVDDQRSHHFGTPEVFGNDYTMEQLENDKKYQDAMMPGIEEEKRKWIYESPDNGKTVYRYELGTDPLKRELVPEKDSNTGVRNERPDGDFSRVFYKYKEDVMLDEAKNYIATTYGSHYTSTDGIQTLDLIQGIGDAEAFCRSNAIKYLSRFGKKEGKSKVDILKAIHYCTLLYHFAGLHDEN